MGYKYYPHRSRRNVTETLPPLGTKDLNPKKVLDPIMKEPDTRLKGFKPASFWK